MPFQIPLEIADEIINIVAQDDPSFSSTKACALVCHEFHHLCRKHIFASIILKPTCAYFPSSDTGITTATTPMLQQLLDIFPEVAHHIRSLSYRIPSEDLRNSSLVETFKKITRLKSFTVWHFDTPTLSLQWNNNSLRPALLHLLHLPTLIHFGILVVENFLLSDLVPCVNLEELKMVQLTVFDEPLASNLPEKSIRLRSISLGYKSAAVTTKMYAMHCADGKPFIDFSCVNRLVIRLLTQNDIEESFKLLKHCNQLASIELDLPVADAMENLTFTGVSKMLYPAMQTLKHLCMKAVFHEDIGSDPLAGLGTELMDMKDNNVIESITIEVTIESDSDCSRGDKWGRLDTLAQPGWPKLQRVSLTIVVLSSERPDAELEHTLRNLLPQTQFPKLSSSKSLSFEFSVRGEQA